MKMLPYLTLLVGAFFVTFGIRELYELKDQIEPFGLLFPLLWDALMVTIGLSIIFRCNCARRAGVAWCIFCLIASLGVGIAAALWMTHPRYEPVSGNRTFFMIIAVAFGIVFGAWQWWVLRSTSAEEWTETRDARKHDKHHPV